MKTQKGITLIALIITIVVLLILAVVAIRAVQGDGIIAYAQNAATDYNQAQILESDRLQVYLNQLDDAQNQINNAQKTENMITFTVKDEEGIESAVFTTLKGTTWEEYIENDPNNTFADWGYEEVITVNIFGRTVDYFLNCHAIVDECPKSINCPVLLTDEIVDGAIYHMWGP